MALNPFSLQSIKINHRHTDIHATHFQTVIKWTNNKSFHQFCKIWLPFICISMWNSLKFKPMFDFWLLFRCKHSIFPISSLFFFVQQMDYFTYPLVYGIKMANFSYLSSHKIVRTSEVISIKQSESHVFLSFSSLIKVSSDFYVRSNE